MDKPKPLALVTGASSGLGVELARELARRGTDLILTARRLERLEAIARELRELAPSIEVRVIKADLSRNDGVENLLADLRRRDRRVTILVNNAGFGVYGPFIDQSIAEIESMNQVNLVALTRLTRELAADMLASGGGNILQVSSFAALAPIPRYSVYSAAKAYVVALTHTLAYELRKTDVRMSVFCPGFLATEFHEVANHRMTFLMKVLSQDPAKVARTAIKGMLRGKILIVPGFRYKLSNLLLRLAPRITASAISAVVVKAE